METENTDKQVNVLMDKLTDRLISLSIFVTALTVLFLPRLLFLPAGRKKKLFNQKFFGSRRRRRRRRPRRRTMPL
jgi:hypothetical protein